MISKVRDAVRPTLTSAALGVVGWLLWASLLVADDGPATYPVPPPPPMVVPVATCSHGTGCTACGGQVAAPADGFQGFGLGFHPGYGYGGRAMGTGPFGGYPFYGGPGYPHPWPCLNRLGKITPFAYYGGPGGPVPGHPNFFTGVGPLVLDEPVVTIEGETYPRDDYGGFSGRLPYPESAFAPYTTMAGVPVSSNPTAIDRLGMDVGPFVIDRGVPGMKITSITPGGVADKAGLRVGDVILSMNGYVTQKWFDLGWVLDNAASSKVLKLNVRSVADGKDHQVQATLP